MFAFSVAPVRPIAGLTAVDRLEQQRSMAVDLELGHIRKAIADCGYTFDALELAMGKNRAYIARVLAGDKSLTLGFFVLLPEDVKARLIELRGPEYGLVVVRPVTGPEAIRQFVGGLVGLLTGRTAA
jgi:hypothetical protein